MKREIKFNAFVPALGIMLKNVTVYPDMIGVSADELEKSLKAKNDKLSICDERIYLNQTTMNLSTTIRRVLKFTWRE